jgi:tetratricopeptide (TPR) repeat protein
MLISVISFITYANTLYNEFVFDDVKMIRDNTAIRTPRAAKQILRDMFVYKPLKGRQGTLIDPGYRPVRFLSYVIDYQFSGLSPVGYHISNIVYHALTSFLLFLVLRRLIGNYAAALTGALIFAVHPVNTEAVAYLTGRKDLLCALFYLLAFYAFVRYTEVRSKKFFALIFIAFLLALFAKEMAVTFPVAILLFDFARARARGLATREWAATLKKEIGLYVPLFLIAIAYSLFALLVKNPAVAGLERAQYIGGSLIASTLTVLRVFAFYIRLLFFPTPLSADYSYNAFPASTSLFLPITTLLSFAFLAGLLFLGVILILRRKYLPGFAIIFFFLSLGPVSQIVPTPEPIAERFLYLPSVSFAILVSLCFLYLFRLNRLKVAFYCGIIVLIALFSFMSAQRGAQWQNTFTLFASAAKTYPACARAQYALAQEYSTRAQNLEKTGPNVISHREWEKSLEAADKCLAILPPEKQIGWLRGIALNAHLLRSIACLNLGKYKNAESELKNLLAERDVFGDLIGEKPDFLDVHFNLAGVYLAEERYSDARAEYAKTIELAEKAQAQCESEGRPEDARKAASRAMWAHYKTAMILAKEDALDSAIESLKKASRFAGKTTDAFGIRLHLGLFYMETGRWREAEEAFKKVLALCANYETSPWEFTGSSPEQTIVGVQEAKKLAHYGLAKCQDRQGRPEEAIKSLQNSLLIDPDFSLAHFSLGDFYYKLGKYDLAEAHFKDVKEDSPDYQRALQYIELVRITRASKEEKAPSIARAQALLAAGKRNLASCALDAALAGFGEALNVLSSLPQTEEANIITADARFHISKILFDKKKYPEAQVSFQKSVDSLSTVAQSPERDSLLARARFLLGKSLAIQGKKTEAIPAFEESVKLLSQITKNADKSLETAELLDFLGEAQFLLGRVPEAESALKKAAEMVPDYPGVFYQLGRVFAAQGKTKEAVKAYEKSIELGSRKVESNYELGLLYFDEADMESAVRHFREVTFLTKDTNYLSNAYQHLGLAYSSLGKFAEAKESYQRFLEFSNDEVEKEKVRARLATDPNLK